MKLMKGHYVEYSLSCGHRTNQGLARIQNTVLCFRHWDIRRVLILQTHYEKADES